MNGKMRNIIFKAIEVGLSIICVGCYSEIVIRLTISPEDFKDLTNPHGFTYTFRDQPPEITRFGAGRMYGQMMAQYNGLTAYVWVMAILFVAILIDKPVHHYVNTMFCLLCASFSISGGTVLINNFQYSSGFTYNMAMTGGACAIINGIVMTFDMLFNHVANNEW